MIEKLHQFFIVLKIEFDRSKEENNCQLKNEKVDKMEGSCREKKDRKELVKLPTILVNPRTRLILKSETLLR